MHVLCDEGVRTFSALSFRFSGVQVPNFRPRVITDWSFEICIFLKSLNVIFKWGPFPNARLRNGYQNQILVWDIFLNWSAWGESASGELYRCFNDRFTLKSFYHSVPIFWTWILNESHRKLKIRRLMSYVPSFSYYDFGLSYFCMIYLFKLLMWNSTVRLVYRTATHPVRYNLCVTSSLRPTTPYVTYSRQSEPQTIRLKEWERVVKQQRDEVVMVLVEQVG